MYWSTGAQYLSAFLSVGVGAWGAVKRNWYQELSTNVSMVSVSRTRRLAALGAGHVLPGRMVVERVAGLVEGDVLRQLAPAAGRTGTGTMPSVSQWMTGIGQPQ